MEQRIVNIHIIKAEEKRAASSEDFQLAEILKQPLIILEGENQ